MVPRRGFATPAARSADPAMPRIGRAFRLVTANDNKAAARTVKWAALAILVLLAAVLAAALS